MRTCPRCSHANPDGAATCATCGGSLEAVPVGGGLPKRTMLGIAPVPASAGKPSAASAGTPGAPSGQDGPAWARSGTVMGLQSPLSGKPTQAADPPPAVPAAPSGSAGGALKQTMVGFGPPAGGTFSPMPASGPAAATLNVPQRAPAGVTPGAAFTSTLPHGVPNAAAPIANAPRGPGSPTFQRTMLGVAHPGIAPIRASPQTAPGPATPAGAAPAPLAVPEAREAPRPTTLVVDTARVPSPPLEVSAPGRVEVPEPIVPKSGLPRGAVVLMIVAAVLAVVAGVVAFLWESPRPMTAIVTSDDHGTESLAVTCYDCPDGTVIALGGATAKLAAHKAALGLVKPLAIGSNSLSIDVKRPGIGRDEAVALTVVVGYRIRGDLSGLADDPPKATVTVEAVPGTGVVVDGHTVVLDGAGKGQYAIDVAREIQGASDAVVPFERKLPYAITETGKPPHQGDVTIRFGIVPLRVDAPGESIVIQSETFMLSGRTLRDGRVSVAGRAITVDTQGRFAQLMNVSAVGETTIVVRADARDHGPRLVPVKVKRVANLDDEAGAFRLSATGDYANIADGDAKRGVAVALDGEVVESRIDGEVTVLVLDVKEGCTKAPCLARVVYGARFDTKRGAKISVFGRVQGSIEGPRTGVKIPAVEADFVLAAKKKR